MAETAHFTYEGNAVLTLGGHTGATTAPAEIEVLSVQHLIPIKVGLKVGGTETFVGAYVDYTDKSVSVAASELASTGMTVPHFQRAVQQFLSDRVERQMAESEARQNAEAQQNYRMAQAAQARAREAARMAVEQDDDE